MYPLTKIQYRWNNQPIKLGFQEEQELEIDEKNNLNELEYEENETYSESDFFNWID
jgi:hypothetical protein